MLKIHVVIALRFLLCVGIEPDHTGARNKRTFKMDRNTSEFRTVTSINELLSVVLNEARNKTRRRLILHRYKRKRKKKLRQSYPHGFSLIHKEQIDPRYSKHRTKSKFRLIKYVSSIRFSSELRETTLERNYEELTRAIRTEIHQNCELCYINDP